VGPRTPEETAARAAFAAVLGVAAEAISVEAGFFELGGNSLTAIRCASHLQAQFPSFSISSQYVFVHSTVAACAANLVLRHDNPSSQPCEDSCRSVPQPRASAAWHQRLGVSLLAVLSLPFHYAPQALQGLVPFEVCVGVFISRNWALLALVAFTTFIVDLLLLVVGIALKWLLVWRLSESSTVLPFFRWRCGRLIHKLMEPALEHLRGTVLLNVVFRALGAKIESGVLIDSTRIYDWDLVQIWSHGSLADQASVSCAHISQVHGFLLRGVIVDAPVGARAHVSAGTTVVNALAPLECSSTSSGTADSSEHSHVKRVPLLVAVAAFFMHGFITAVAVSSSVAITFGTLMVVAGPYHRVESFVYMMFNLPIRFFLVLWVHSWSSTNVQPFMFTALSAVVCAFIPRVKDGDPVRHTVGGRLLEMIMHDHRVSFVANLCAQVNDPSAILRLFRAPVADKSHCLFPRVSRPELVVVHEGVTFGGSPLIGAACATPTGLFYKRVELQRNSFLGAFSECSMTVSSPTLTHAYPRLGTGRRRLSVAGRRHPRRGCSSWEPCCLEGEHRVRQGHLDGSAGKISVPACCNCAPGEPRRS
jgi:hypothetical protein